MLDGSWPTGNCSNGATGQHTCTPDPGSKAVDCTSEEADLDFVDLLDFQDPTAQARALYAYTDKSAVIASFNQGWEPNLVSDPFSRCGGSPGNVLHIQGGPFLAWGGGVGKAARDFLGGPPNNAPVPDSVNLDCFHHPNGSMCPPTNLPEYLQGKWVNASQYEGVAVWARRGPDSQGGIRVMVGDQYTDDDISFLMYQNEPTRTRNCERVRECACTNHKPCTQWQSFPMNAGSTPQKPSTDYPQLASWAATTSASDSWSCAPPDGTTNPKGYFCEDPTSGIVPGYFNTDGPTTRCNTCLHTRCDEPYEAFPDFSGGITPSVDAQFNGKPCTPYATRSGISTSFCFDPAQDPPPAESDQQCGDHWMSGIYLTNQWTLYLVPFTDMLQQGFAKKSAKMDLTAVTVVRLTWDGGYIDYWIGKIAFYKHKSH